MTKIEWTNETWNPVTGCDKVSQGCKNCYAEIMHRRLMAMFPEKYSKPFLGNIETHGEDLFTPFNWKKPRMVFVNSMSDLFHDDVPDSFIDRVFAIMILCPQHTFQILTKRPNRMWHYFTSYTDRILINRWADACQDMGIQDSEDHDLHLQAILNTTIPLKNVWLGTSCEDQKAADERIPVLAKVPAAIRFLSCEPLIGPLDICQSIRAYQFKEFGSFHSTYFGDKIQWVICGGESGHHARPMHPDWARAIRDQCKAASVPFFFKQWGEWLPYGQLQADHSLHVSSNPSASVEFEGPKKDHQKVGKHQSGNYLDGVQHLAFPESQQLNHTSI